MLNAKRTLALRREQTAASQVPYTALLSPHVVRTTLLDFVQVFRLNGASFETADDAQLNNWHERLNVLWRNIASPHVALWTHVVRRRVTATQMAFDGAGFADRLHERYGRRLAGETLMVNELYLALIYRPTSGLATQWAAKIVSGAGREALARDVAQVLETCEKLAQTVRASLARYEPQPLGDYQRGGRRHSALLEFLGLLLNGEWQPVTPPTGPLAEALVTSRLRFGNEVIEYRLPTRNRLGAVLGIKEYATPVVVGAYNRLLSAPFEFVLTQSFSFISKAAGQGLLERQMHRMANAGDFAVSQADHLREALDALSSNEFVMGDHHLSLQLIADGLANAPGDELPWIALNESVALARSLLAETGVTVAREDLALEAAFWAQLPGNFSLRPRKAPITSRNFSALAPFHNYPTGRAVDNHWGEALALLVTAAHSPYHFSLHASDPAEADGGSRRDTGHTFICGPTGSGKTVFIGFLIAMFSRRGVTQVIFDKDRGLEILVRALDGEYLPLRSGTPTGFNPLQLPINAANVEFLKHWLRLLTRRPNGDPPSVREQTDLDQALRGTLALSPPTRRLSRLIEFLDPTDPEGVYARLARWCAITSGDYAWVFDNSEDSVLPRMGSRTVIGFDVTEFLDHELARPPLTLYLFHLVRRLLDGRRLVCWMDEFWRLLSDPAFEGFAKDGPKTWRKLNGVMCAATQSASDVLSSPISRTIIEQTPTKVFFPNGDASAEEYIGGLGLTEREFRLIKERLEPGSRSFLIKQGHHSVVCRLDLRGFEPELRVISGRASELERVRRLMTQFGERPEQWLSSFMGPENPSA